MNHLTTEEEDLGFQEGRAVAQYLERNMCFHQVESHCHVCIAAAVNAVEREAIDEARREQIKNFERRWTVI